MYLLKNFGIINASFRFFFFAEISNPVLRISKTAKKNCCNEQKQQFFVGKKNHYRSFAINIYLVLSATPLHNFTIQHSKIL